MNLSACSNHRADNALSAGPAVNDAVDAYLYGVSTRNGGHDSQAERVNADVKKWTGKVTFYIDETDPRVKGK